MRKVFVPKNNGRCTAYCEKCGGPLGFYLNERGKYSPCNPDGTDHFDICRARRYALAKKGRHVDVPHEEAYYTAHSRFAVRESDVDGRGKKPHAGCCERILPWDEPCTECPNRLAAATPTADGRDGPAPSITTQ